MLKYKAQRKKQLTAAELFEIYENSNQHDSEGITLIFVTPESVFKHIKTERYIIFIDPNK